MSRRTFAGALVPLLLVLGCGGSTLAAPDTGDVAEDRAEAEDVVDVDGDGPDDDGADPDVDAGADADADVEDDGADVPDAPDDGDADVAEASKRSVLAVTAGGGTAHGGSYGLTLSIGTPQPMGTGSSAGFHGAFGPGAVQGQ